MNDSRRYWPTGAEETLARIFEALGLRHDADASAIARQMRAIAGTRSESDPDQGGRLWLGMLRGIAAHIAPDPDDTYDSAEVNQTVMTYTGLWGDPETQDRWASELGDASLSPSSVLIYDVLPRLIVGGVLSLVGHKLDGRVDELLTTGTLGPYRPPGEPNS